MAGFSIVTSRVQVYLGTFVLSKKETYTAQEKSAIFLLSSHFQFSFCFYLRPTFLSTLQCIALIMYFSSSVFSSLLIAFNV